MPDHHVESGHRVAVRCVDGEPGRVADDVEPGVCGPPLLGQAAAQQTVVLVDHTKVGHETMCQTVPVERISTLITDAGADAHQLEAIREIGVAVLVAR